MIKKNKVYIIAEVGVNHNGSLDLAMKSIMAAAQSGADAVKFQSFITDEFMSNNKMPTLRIGIYTAGTPKEIIKNLLLEKVHLRRFCEKFIANRNGT